MKSLRELVRGIEIVATSGPANPPLTGLHYDSRQIRAGMAFAAIRGEVVDGNHYVPAALDRGALAILSGEPCPATLAEAVTWVQVAHPRAALASAAANWFGRPAERLRLAGITGTNGKTTTAFLLEAILRTAGIPCGLLGTIEYHIGDQVLPAPHTTPESYDLQDLLARMHLAGAAAAVMEVSSHALALDRVYGCRFAVAAFTNLTQDHLDFHGTMAAYAAAKRRLFEGLGAPAPRAAVVNVDDPAADEMIRGFPGRVIGYGFSERATLRATNIVSRPEGLSFRLVGMGWNGDEFRSPLLGRVNALNLMAAIGCGLAMEIDRATVLEGVLAVNRVPGRFERVYAGQPFVVAVDYAHTPDALDNVLRLAREMTRGRVLAVFGCGGDRDRGKRPLMGQAAVSRADWVMLTSDNPRSEAPEAILDDIEAGTRSASVPVAREVDRRAAIHTALAEAKAGDVVVIAGKGHEDYQIIGDQKFPFSDVAEVETWLKAHV